MAKETTKIILCGCCGKMGSAVTKTVETRENIQIAAGVDIKECMTLPYPVFASFDEVVCKADVIVDFSNPGTLPGLLDYAENNHMPAVLCATGYTQEQIALIEKASEKTAIFRSGNMSLGINLISELAKAAAKVLGETFDVEIVEAHHNQKLDAPSGTAIMLENAVEEGLNYKPEIVYDRHSVSQKRDKKEIGIHSIRGGTIVGEHEIIFAGNDEIVKISHTALSKNVFASGAVDAAIYMCGKETGLFDMNDVIKNK
ncbi:MAG: 4-hydroxy-tetrahydrodipicolinate reductase [Clostridiales bacterium]|nr:4-hydroxy-tetrahydrodipicolinate reductase [Clostridiales bacterium]